MITYSIITITYDAAQHLPRTVESVLRQTYQDIEHIIIDGASTDDTLALAKDYMQRSYAAGNGHEVKIVCEPDNGLYDAMNKGLRMATGDYICFLNAGDELHDNNTLDNMTTNSDILDIQESNLPLPAALYGDTDIVDNKGRFLFHRRLAAPEQLTWRSFRSGMLVCHQAFYVRADIAKATLYDLHYKYSADVDWCIRIMKSAEAKGLLLYNTHLVTTKYMQEGATTAHHKESLHERYEIMCKYYGKTSTVIMHLWFVIRKIIRP